MLNVLRQAVCDGVLHQSRSSQGRFAFLGMLSRCQEMFPLVTSGRGVLLASAGQRSGCWQTPASTQNGPQDKEPPGQHHCEIKKSALNKFGEILGLSSSQPGLAVFLFCIQPQVTTKLQICPDPRK